MKHKGKLVVLAALSLVAATITGCMSLGQPQNDELLDRAEFATGVPMEDLKVVPGSIKNEFVPDPIKNYYREEYKVQDNQGQIWRCSYTYIQETFVPYYNNDIQCNKIGAPSKSTKTTKRRKKAAAALQ